MSKPKTLSLAGLCTVFGVSSMSVYLWRQGTPTKEALAEPYTPAALKRWAKANGRPIIKDPGDVLAREVKAYEKADRASAVRSTGKAIEARRNLLATVGRKSTRKEKVQLQRSGSGKLSGLRASA